MFAMRAVSGVGEHRELDTPMDKIIVLGIGVIAKRSILDAKVIRYAGYF